MYPFHLFSHNHSAEVCKAMCRAMWLLIVLKMSKLQILVSLIGTAVMQGITTEKLFLGSEVMLYENQIFLFLVLNMRRNFSPKDGQGKFYPA